ncbi:DUF6238 family protein [Streptomyces sp. B1866]|uniref:DUF6238 family protein n=1 Tax=Streptomyces sp. B1866 TaxID=3075431 RepID=UPI00288C985C|nr:DUF6238 family protein [Streptomyces sp. B1866]MDT3395341.1 DUF6238 family protein [Streptomyces sp. B1866]
MPSPPPSPADPVPDFVPYATAALDFHHALNLPAGTLAASRTELDSLHAHLVSLHDLLDAHATRTRQVAPAEGDHLAAARIRLWQAAEHLHAAFHTAPHPHPDTAAGRAPGREECRTAGLPEGAPELTVCQRHQRTAARLRRDTTPTDLHDPFTGLIRH